MIRYTLAALALLAAAPALAQTAPPVSDALTGKLAGPDGADLGTITIKPAPNGVILRVEAKGLTPGWHAMHFHEKASCSDEKFASAGGHVHSMTPVTHGLLNADANDAGDLPNLFAHADGTATAEVYSSLVSAKPGGKLPALMDEDGSSVVIHALPDDYTTQPIGGAGVRVACAAIQ
ncbi:superoxide dismutase[Cu-Zn] [Asticcacaulis sp.]|uniref:superoxide dismutase[Cu-Zn] n=1 Tax=Asticcacaulis sp. TaxID=1872648 RepID=UPI002CDBE0AA|nr:superoxide dismutase family protein [Asticcacaulis sp.]HTM82911.1 superoxide dismutase family protein [Asticcacaulis sp.]